MRPERAIPTGTALEVRSAGAEHIFEGYAAKWDEPSRPLPYTETVRRGAFTRTIQNPPNGRQTFVIDHDDTKLAASTISGRLRLAEDSIGLITEARCVDTSYVRDYRELAEAGEAGGMSFEFSPAKGGAPFSTDGRQRSLEDVRLFHVTALTGKTPAYGATTAAMRALANAMDADYEALGELFDAVREGRKLDTDEWQLLERAAATVAPEGLEPRWSSAASDASNATYALSSLLSLLGNETDDTAQLRVAIDALQAFIASEAAEIGTEADTAASAGMGMRDTPNLNAARALLGGI